MPNQDVYEGNLVDGSYDGFGTLTIKGGDVKNGTWSANQLVKTPKGKKSSYKATVISIPKVLRVVPKEEQELLKIFDAPPAADSVSKEVIEAWTKAGKFELENFINNKTMSLDQKLIIDTTSIPGF